MPAGVVGEGWLALALRAVTWMGSSFVGYGFKDFLCILSLENGFVFSFTLCLLEYHMKTLQGKHRSCCYVDNATPQYARS